MKMLKGVAVCLGAGMLCVMSPPVDAKDAGDFLVRLRGVVVNPDESGSTDIIGGDLSVRKGYAPEIDFSYYFTNNIAMELIATTTRHKLELKDSDAGNVDLGTVRVLPPSLLLQYHFFSQDIISPYIGAGINYTIFYDESNGGNALVSNVDLDDSLGYVFQAGADLQFPDSNWVMNVDVKRIYVDPDVQVKLSNGQKVNGQNIDLDPWVIGAGFGYKFPVGTPW